MDKNLMKQEIRDILNRNSVNITFVEEAHIIDALLEAGYDKVSNKPTVIDGFITDYGQRLITAEQLVKSVQEKTVDDVLSMVKTSFIVEAVYGGKFDDCKVEVIKELLENVEKKVKESFYKENK